MTREEWYAHTVQDHIQAVTEYVDIVQDGNYYTDLTGQELNNLRTYLYTLNHEIDMRLEDLAR